MTQATRPRTRPRRNVAFGNKRPLEKVDKDHRATPDAVKMDGKSVYCSISRSIALKHATCEVRFREVSVPCARGNQIAGLRFPRSRASISGRSITDNVGETDCIARPGKHSQPRSHVGIVLMRGSFLVYVGAPVVYSHLNRLVRTWISSRFVGLEKERERERERDGEWKRAGVLYTSLFLANSRSSPLKSPGGQSPRCRARTEVSACPAEDWLLQQRI